MSSSISKRVEDITYYEPVFTPKNIKVRSLPPFVILVRFIVTELFGSRTETSLVCKSGYQHSVTVMWKEQD